STAITRSVDFIHALRTPTGSHERIAIVEVFGRNSGETALISAYLADADRVAISEVPFDVERLAQLLADDRERNPSRYSVLVISEG
ncbi:6-phosphofructokinase, partial [Klebsiella pneumoniae]|nr:6-phosphofructokinase [Klebsiella pneumoniae]